MKNRISKRRFIGLLAAAVLLATPAFAGDEPKFKELYALGDSLTDTGNLAAILGFRDGLVSGPNGEFLGVVLKDGRLSDSALYIERLSKDLNLPDAGASSTGGGSFAVTGAVSNVDLTATAPFSLPGSDLSSQAAALLAREGNLSDRALVVIFIGSNDIFAAVGSPPGSIDAAAALEQSARNVVETIRLLNAAGAKNFLVLNAPNIARTPVLNLQVAEGALPPEVLELAKALTIHYNRSLFSLTAALNADSRFSGRVWFHPTFAVAEFIASPLGARITGLTSTTPCAPELGFGQDCTTSTFWDLVHVTGAVHEIFANTAKLLLRLPPLVGR